MAASAKAMFICALCLGTTLPMSAIPGIAHGTISSTLPSFGSASSKKHKAAVAHASPAMSSDRATQIQAALIRAGYLSGEPTGTWDATSNAAMQKFQGDNGWQTKLTPDSRALIKLGLGPPTPQTSQP